MNTLRCKAGDLAVIVGAHTAPENIGRFVIVERRATPGKDFAATPALGDLFVWVIRPASTGQLMIRHATGFTKMHDYAAIADCNLRPIRPNEGEDESLSWSRPVVMEAA